MRPKLALAWFIVSLALTALLVVQSRTNQQRKQLLEKVQLELEAVHAEAKTLRARLLQAEKENHRLKERLGPAPEQDRARGGPTAKDTTAGNSPALPKNSP